MVINQQQRGHKGSFYIGEREKPLAEMTYTLPSPEKMIIDHTEVSYELRGQNAGYHLMHTAVKYARTHHIKIIPLCAFAAAVFKKKPEYADVLA